MGLFEHSFSTPTSRRSKSVGNYEGLPLPKIKIIEIENIIPLTPVAPRIPPKITLIVER
jgi:hypothetical protein